MPHDSYQAFAALLLLSSGVIAGEEAPPPYPDPPEMASYHWLDKQVFTQCRYCHMGIRKPDLTSYESIREVVVAGAPAQSRLYQMVASGRMPKGARLSRHKIAAIYWWIKNGARRD